MGWNMITKNSFFMVLLIGGTIVLSKEIPEFTSSIDDFPEILKQSMDFGMQEEEDMDIIAEREQVLMDIPSFGAAAQIMGRQMATYENRTIYGFLGIKYGLMPTSTTRFKPPIRAGKYWTEEPLNATRFGDVCAQSSSTRPQSEDCLVLNVYTPYLPEAEIEKLPVMLFIHGGSFTGGASSSYYPFGLLDYEIVLVTINYRLGAFGFFMLNNMDAPGNTALYDMVEALQWTQDHIEDFGGDPEKVTIFGESAGAVAVSYLTIVEPAIGLFRAAISESGSIFDPWAIDIDPTYAAGYIANYLDCDIEDPLVYDCVAAVTTDQLIQAERSLISSDRRSGLMGFRGAAPSIQTFEPTDEFQLMVTKHPREYLPDGTFSNVPLMTGSNKQEGSLVLSISVSDYLTPNNMLNNATYMQEQMIQDILGSTGVIDDSQSLSKALQEVYCYDVDMTNNVEVCPCMIDMMGALFLKAGGWELSRLHSIYSDQPVYYYAFEFTTGRMDNEYGIQLGVSHGADIVHLFPWKHIQEERVPTMKRMTRMWTNFAIHLNPTPEDDEMLSDLGVPIWTPYHHLEPHFLIIDEPVWIGDVYSDRWTITMDEIRAKNAGNSTTTTSSEAPPLLTTPDCDFECTQNKLEQRDAFLAVMITFIVISVILAAIAGFLFYKTRQ